MTDKNTTLPVSAPVFFFYEVPKFFLFDLPNYALKSAWYGISGKDDNPVYGDGAEEEPDDEDDPVRIF